MIGSKFAALAEGPKDLTLSRSLDQSDSEETNEISASAEAFPAVTCESRAKRTIRVMEANIAPRAKLNGEYDFL